MCMELEHIESTTFKQVSEIVVPDTFANRRKSGLNKVDEFFNGGLLPGSTFTLTAPAGGGKTTFALQLLESMANLNYRVGVVSCEESIFQIAYTSNRLCVSKVKVANMSDVDSIVACMKDFDVLIIDSFQGLHSKEDGYRDNERYCIQKIVSTAKQTGCTVGIICHLTKMGILKGSTVIPHAVDMNLKIVLSDEEGASSQRTFVIEKNRFGPCNELQCDMTNTGYAFGIVAEATNAKVSKPKVTRRMETITAVLEIKGPITLKKVMDIVDGDMHKAHNVLREMVLNDKLKKCGHGKASKYVLVR